MMGFGWILVLIVVALLFAGMLFPNARTSLTPKGDAKEVPASKETPLDIARQRYARGELSKKAFEQLKRDLA